MGARLLGQRPKPRKYKRARLPLTCPSLHPLLLRKGDTKEWKELSAAERMSAQWLGYDEQRWKQVCSCQVICEHCLTAVFPGR